MDESWDTDFEGELHVPEIVRGASNYVKMETLAAKKLAETTSQIREILLQDPQLPSDLMARAISIVTASSVDPDDDIYKTSSWQKSKHLKLGVAGDSFEEILNEAIEVYRLIRAQLDCVSYNMICHEAENKSS